MRKGFTILELLIVVAIIGIIASMAIPDLIKASLAAKETAAVKAISTVHTAQAQYYSQFGRHAASLSELGPPAAGADLIGRDLAGGEKGGYHFELRPQPAGYVLQGQAHDLRLHRPLHVLFGSNAAHPPELGQ